MRKSPYVSAKARSFNGWAKHLKKYGKRLVNKSERKTIKVEARKAA